MREQGRVAVTGAHGRIGTALVEQLAAHGYSLTLLDRPGSGVGTMRALGTIIELDLAQPAASGLFADVDVVVHLAGEARHDASWETLLPDNIQASYNVASAAMRAGCRRLIVASSVHAVYASPTRPVGSARSRYVYPDLYGVTDMLRGSARVLVRASRTDVAAAAIRIGAFQTVEAARAPGAAERIADTFIAVPDLLVARARDQRRVPVRRSPRRCSWRGRTARHGRNRRATRLARPTPFPSELRPLSLSRFGH